MNTPLDKDIAKTHTWLMSFITHQDWDARKRKIEEYLKLVLTPKKTREEAQILESIAIKKDKTAWYVYLAETYLYEPHKYEPAQGARIMPIFKRLGSDFNNLSKIGGLDERIKRMFFSERNSPDSVLFEVTAALLWVRNGWNVSFIEESPKAKSPDFIATKDGNEYFVECKRLSKSSEYSKKEREKWLLMWQKIRDKLTDIRIPFLFDIVFHVELKEFADDFLVKALLPKLKFVTVPCEIINDEKCTINVDFVDLKKANEHLEKYFVKTPSDQLNQLIAGYREIDKGFTCSYLGEVGTFGESGCNRYVSEIAFAIGVFWSCDSEKVIQKKARDIRGHLSSALEQLPKNEKSVIHVGLETHDGREVEAIRYSRIFQTVPNFDANGKNLKWVYCNLFQSYSPPEQDWVIDETVYSFTNKMPLEKIPLNSHYMVIPETGEPLPEEVHWLRERP